MSRPRTKTDAAVLGAAAEVIARLGPGNFTLADIAKEAGLAPATLIQRFGSKHGLILALVKLSAEGTEACFDRVRAAHRSPLKALFAAVEEMAQMAASPEALANTLAFLQLFLTDPEFRHWTLINSRAMLAGYRKLLDEAVRSRELRRCDTEGLARLINEAAHGSMVLWAFFQEGSAAAWMRRDMELLIAPYRTARSKTAS